MGPIASVGAGHLDHLGRCCHIERIGGNYRCRVNVDVVRSVGDLIILIGVLNSFFIFEVRIIPSVSCSNVPALASLKRDFGPVRL